MPKTDELESKFTHIEVEDVEYKADLSTALFSKIGESLNSLCSNLESFSYDTVTFGSTSWTSPAHARFAVIIGFSGSGGGGGTAPAIAFGIDNDALYNGGSGGSGGNTTFNGQIVARGGSGGRGFRFRARRKNGGINDVAEANRINAECDVKDYVMGLSSPSGGRGAHFTSNINNTYFFGPNEHGLGGGEGGETGRLGILPIEISGGTTYSVSLGSGGAAGSNHPDASSNASSLGYGIQNSQPGANSTGMIILYFGAPK